MIEVGIDYCANNANMNVAILTHCTEQGAAFDEALNSFFQMFAGAYDTVAAIYVTRVIG